MNNHYLIIDISNVAHMCRHQNPNEKNPDVISSLTIHVMFNMINKYYKKLRPTHLILAFDKHNWRKDYTLSDKCVSGKIYKGDRNQNLTKSEQELLDHFRKSLEAFEELVTKHTGIICLAADGCEADDFIARFCQLYSDDKITILSSDKDYLQCLTSPSIKLMNPLTQTYRTLEEYNYDIKWHKFFKFIRANEDNIQCAFPRVRKTRLQKAYDDEFEMTNLLNETWTNQNGKTFRVGDLYKENCLLMDLSLQPDNIKTLMDDTIKKTLDSPGLYSHFHFLAFCGKFDLKNTVKYIDNLMPALINKPPQNMNDFYD